MHLPGAHRAHPRPGPAGGAAGRARDGWPGAVPARAPTTAPAGAAGFAGVAPTPLTACRGDDDCVAVAGDCCGCSAGGTRGVVARGRVHEFEAAQRAHCAATMCATMMSQHPSCSRQPRCVNGNCQLVLAPLDAAPAPPP